MGTDWGLFIAFHHTQCLDSTRFDDCINEYETRIMASFAAIIDRLMVCLQSSAVGDAGPFVRPPHVGLRLLFVRAWQLQRWGQAHMANPWWRCYWNTCSGMEIRHGEQCLHLSPDQVMLIPPDTDFAGLLHQPCGHLSMPFTLHEDFRVQGLACN